MATFDNSILGIAHQPAPPSTRMGITRNPFRCTSWKEVEPFSAHIETFQTPILESILSTCSNILQNPEATPHTTLEATAEQLTQYFLDLQSSLMLKLGKTLPTPTHRHYLRRKLGRRMSGIQKKVGLLQQALLQLPKGPEHQVTRDSKIQELRAIKQQHRQVCREDFLQAIDNARTNARTKYSTNRKETHRQIFSNKDLQEEQTPLTTLEHPTTGTIRTDAAGVLHATHTYFQQLLNPQDPSPSYHTIPPWQQQQGRDSLTLQAPPPSLTHPDMTNLIYDPISFLSMTSHLSKGKAPGPDGLANETIQWAPQKAKLTLHQFLLCLWKTRYTPICWSKSHTCLLYKKGPHTRLSSYRPIAMANSLSKVWTGWIATSLSHFAETHRILSTTQEGFRPQRTSQRQLRNLINVIEDAQLHHKNLYLL